MAQTTIEIADKTNLDLINSRIPSTAGKKSTFDTLKESADSLSPIKSIQHLYIDLSSITPTFTQNSYYGITNVNIPLSISIAEVNALKTMVFLEEMSCSDYDNLVNTYLIGFYRMQEIQLSKGSDTNIKGGTANMLYRMIIDIAGGMTTYFQNLAIINKLKMKVCVVEFR